MLSIQSIFRMPPKKKNYERPKDQPTILSAFAKQTELVKCPNCEGEFPSGTLLSHSRGCGKQEEEVEVVFSGLAGREESDEEALMADDFSDGEIEYDESEEESDTQEKPIDNNKFKTSRARYLFNIDLLERKYSGAAGQSDVEIDLRNFDMLGTNAEVKKEFKRLAKIGERFSFSAMSTPVINAADLESRQLAEKVRKLNEAFRSTQQGDLGLSTPHTPLPSTVSLAITTGPVDSPLTSSRSRTMLVVPSPLRREGPSMGVIDGEDEWIDGEDGETIRSGYCNRARRPLGATMGPDALHDDATPAKRPRKTTRTEEQETIGYEGGKPIQRVPPCLLMEDEDALMKCAKWVAALPEVFDIIDADEEAVTAHDKKESPRETTPISVEKREEAEGRDGGERHGVKREPKTESASIRRTSRRSIRKIIFDPSNRNVA